MQPLSIDVSQYGKPEGIVENIGYSLSLSLPEITEVSPVNNEKFVICGSGPSLEKHIEQIRNEKNICAIKGAYDYLMERGIVPDYYLSVEPRYRPIKTPHKDTVFLMASRCHKDNLDELKDFNVLLWHSWSNDDEEVKGHMAIGGGSTSGLRAMTVAYVLGYREIQMYGMDSCLGLRGEKRIDQDPLSDGVVKIDVIVGKKRFLCNMAMAAQAQDLQNTWDVMPDLHLSIAGEGLLAAIMEERVKQGLLV